MSQRENTTESTAPATTYTRQGLPPWQIALDYQDGQRIGSHDTLLVLDLETGRISLDISPRWYDPGTSPRRWYGVDRTYTLRPTTDAEDLEEALDDAHSPIREALERVYRGGEVRGEGSDLRGVLDDDAQDAEYELARLLEALPDTDWSAWEASEWLRGDATDDQAAGEVGITADTTDEDLRALLPDLEYVAARDHIMLYGSLLEALQEIRDALREDEDAA